ncbi:aminotransferase class V-fold PLP-dependent enzyme [Intestinibacter bartlettii]|uniref:aminotransferase class V-fold PLP-dependent enzyme n=1 Tax=Intestinibacter bartlettii TaxID=261299 RepID=UPI0006C5A25D|nr:aminotransferase class V-fold PLP-dependent enzyme [Intestinibacter bartlettii]SCI61541.1 Probable cysteine desulfurase [uncultured Clostridium sp.]MCC2706761.1 aminotransferase class V-fold PLP-dependent enzyme [Intestinibacter bartlettii]MCC2762210.1 aminotransferase class V-fold PLP-dependent enzyme [Intestinibacter bartlettii]MDU6472633.1 aminotransferase class V-fold PLP-dependent enzyme [Intestinibacter bartlettii]CUO60540.1 cysteine desulfurase CsdB [Intestinibacter bartlettii]
MKDIYFDNSSTSFPKAPNVGRAMGEFIENGAFNINRGSYEGAYEAGSAVLDTREMLKDLFNCPNSKNVVFTPSVTYSLNFFIKGFLKPGDHVLVTSVEHNAVMRPLVQMEKLGVEFDAVPCDEEGGVTADDFRAYIKENTKAIITTHASNVCGTIIPIEEIGALCKEKGLVYAVDTAQTAGILNIDMQKANIDFLAFTGHKGLLGPQGIGGFIASDKLEGLIDPVISGGTGSLSDSEEIPDFLPDRFESGTLNLPGIIGLHQALVYLKEAGIDNMRKEKMEITKYFLDQVKEIDGVKVAGKKTVEGRLGVVSIDFEGFDNSIVSFYLSSKYKIMTRVGMHCAPRAHKTLKTFPQGTVRFSFSHFNTKEEVDICINAIKTILSDLRQGGELI